MEAYKIISTKMEKHLKNRQRENNNKICTKRLSLMKYARKSS